MKTSTLMAATLCVFVQLAAAADNETQNGQIKIPVAQQGDNSIARPSRGMLKADVEKKFGAPQQVTGPIGQPPITRWFYENFTVTFEHDHVVHTVLKMKVPASEVPVDVQAETQATTTSDTIKPER